MRLSGRHQASVAAPVEAVAAALASLAGAWSAEGGGAVVAPSRSVRDGAVDLDWEEDADLYGRIRLHARVAPDAEGGTVWELSVRAVVHVPYFGWFVRPLLAGGLRHGLRMLGAGAALLATGAVARREDLPAAPQPWYAVPGPVTPAEAATLATLCMVLLVVGYCSSVFTQTADAVVRTFHTTDAALGVSLAVTRVGSLVAIVGAVLADRVGRRRIVLVGVGGLCVTTLACAAAPGFAVLTGLQLAVRGFATLAGTVGFMVVVEEAPEKARAYLLGFALLAGGGGYGLGAALLPLLDVDAGFWRVSFALGGLGLFLLPGLARRLRETRRFSDLRARGARTGRATEVVDARYGGRFAAMCTVVFLLQFAAAPTSQFTNRYLMDERGMSGLGISFMRAATSSVLVVVALWVGGVLAERRGRRHTARWTVVVATVADAVFFLGTGVFLWAGMLLSSVAGAVSAPSMSSFGSELFPTEVRGTAHGGLILVGVLGAVSGLVFTGYMADALGSVGVASALTDAGPLLAAAVFMRFLPEARGRALDDVSPPEV